MELENGRLDGVLLDNIIADRYGCVPKRPTVTCVPYDIARGTYVIGMRRADTELAKALDGALAGMRADGELERILRKHELWDARQTQTDVGVGVSPRTRELDLDTLEQFGFAALETLKISFLAFLLAVPIGILLAVLRVYAASPVPAFARVYIELF